MKEFIIKLFIGMVVNSFTVEQIVAAFNKLKEDVAKKVLESESKWDDFALNAVLQSEDEVLELLMMAKSVADDKVKESENTLDNALWLPVSGKLGEVIEALKAK